MTKVEGEKKQKIMKKMQFSKEKRVISMLINLYIVIRLRCKCCIIVLHGMYIVVATILM